MKPRYGVPKKDALTLDCSGSRSGLESPVNSLVVSILIEILVGRCKEFESKRKKRREYKKNKIEKVLASKNLSEIWNEKKIKIKKIIHHVQHWPVFWKLT